GRVLEPAVRIGDLGPVVVVHHVDLPRDRVRERDPGVRRDRGRSLGRCWRGRAVRARDRCEEKRGQHGGAHPAPPNSAPAPPPPPMHIVTTPYRPPRRLSSRSRVAVSRVPVTPSGWPSAIAPPLTFTFDLSIPSSRMQYSACAAKASLSSKRSMSFTSSLFFARSFRTAGTGPMPMISGGTPATWKSMK